jgi:hypothetical protein
MSSTAPCEVSVIVPSIYLSSKNLGLEGIRLGSVRRRHLIRPRIFFIIINVHRHVRVQPYQLWSIDHNQALARDIYVLA